MVELGQADRVRDSRSAYQAASADAFISAIERITGREVRSFASAVDAQRGVVFENFIFERVFEPYGQVDAADPVARRADL